MKNLIKRIIVIPILLGFYTVCHGQAVEVYNTPGLGTWVCPSGVTTITVECWGGGGAGGGGSHGGAVIKGGGGSGGGYVRSTLAVIPGQTYNYKIGAGGIGGVPTTDDEISASGENTWFDNASVLNAPGGVGGKGRISSSATVLFGAGGEYVGSTAIGDVKFNGGNGGTATSAMSGSGGSSGGTASDGTNGGPVNTPSIVVGGGNGAQGRNNEGKGGGGGMPGGGGSGCRCNSGTQPGGSGGNGQIRINYTGTFSTTVTTDWSNNILPQINYKRGCASPGQNGFKDTQQTREFLEIQAAFGMNIHNGIRNLFLDNPTNEFYQENGIYKNQQRADYTSIRKYASNLGLELISQVGGTPRNSNYEFDSTFYKGPYTPTFEPWTDFAPIPKEGYSMQEFQRNFSEWAINADKAIAPDFHSIWIGTQEIAHTLGFPGGNINDTDDNKKLNIRRFTDYWKPISDNLRNAGARTGALQLNSSNSDLYNYAIDYMIQQQLKVDFLTFQFYQYGDTSALTNAIKALDRYNQVYPGTKIIIDRGASGKIIPDDATGSQSNIYHLAGELCAMNNANKMYAITLDAAENTMAANQNNMNWQMRKWINTMGPIRCNLTGLPSGFAGFVTRSDNKLSAVIWNRGINTQTINLKTQNHNFGAGARLTVKHASANGFISSTAQWNAIENSIDNIILKQYDFVLIDLEPAASGFNDEINYKISVYPNPTSETIFVDGISNIRSLSLIALDGRMLRKTNEYSMDVRGIEHGTYIVKVELSSGMSVCKKIIVR